MLGVYRTLMFISVDAHIVTDIIMVLGVDGAYMWFQGFVKELLCVFFQAVTVLDDDLRGS